MDGDLSHYGLEALTRGDKVTDELVFLDGTIEDIPPDGLELPFIEMPSGIKTDVHIFKESDDLYFITLIDTHAAYEKRQKDQQLANELILLRDKKNKLYAELQKALSDLEQKNSDLLEASQAKSRFIGTMSHEFRTPITSILGYSQLLREKTSTMDDASFYLDALDRGTHNLMLMIDNLLEQASIETGEFDIQHMASDLSALLSDLYEMLYPLALRKKLEFDWHVTGLPSTRIYADAMRLRQVIVNLVGNAIKYTDSGKINVHAHWENDQFDFSVEDSGPGIPQADQERIFMPFQQGTETTPHRSGAGLGLAITRYLVTRMDGVLKLESKLGKGSLFSFNIPATEVIELHSERNRPETSAYSPLILLADDDEDIRELVNIHLHNAGYQTLTCSSGQEAVEAIKTSPVDLAIMDMHMPVMNGAEAVNILRQGGFNNPIIALTASISSYQALSNGCDEYVKKPVDIDQLLNTIEHLLF
jgi:signal transduction histidine kinase/CheY-like chemotaxis protein